MRSAPRLQSLPSVQFGWPRSCAACPWLPWLPTRCHISLSASMRQPRCAHRCDRTCMRCRQRSSSRRERQVHRALRPAARRPPRTLSAPRRSSRLCSLALSFLFSTTGFGRLLLHSSQLAKQENVDSARLLSRYWIHYAQPSLVSGMKVSLIVGRNFTNLYLTQHPLQRQPRIHLYLTEQRVVIPSYSGRM